MIKAVVKFWGSTNNQYGMPEPYHSYMVVASPWNNPTEGVASIVTLSDAPLAKRHYPVLQGGERAAFDAAVAALKTEPGNQGLAFHLHEG